MASEEIEASQTILDDPSAVELIEKAGVGELSDSAKADLLQLVESHMTANYLPRARYIGLVTRVAGECGVHRAVVFSLVDAIKIGVRDTHKRMGTGTTDPGPFERQGQVRAIKGG